MKMLVGRLMLAATAFILVIGETTSRSQMREELVAQDRQIVDKDAIAESRQGRMALHAEPPANKAKREQALRHILAARRRQIQTPRSITSKPLKALASLSKEPPDMLEAQETRHGVFVTASMGDQLEIIEDDEDSEISAIAPTMQLIDTPKRLDTSTVVSNLTSPPGASPKKESNIPKDSSLASRVPKNLDDPSRRKNTVIMPDSLYNHFRPVESNVPVEDMSQFLYFGQKIQPENTTGNNSVEVTSISPALSRRRLNPKRFSTTLSSIPKFEEIMNEEMDIGLDRSPMERNKILKSKSLFRSTGIYSRRPPVRPSDPTIITNVILTPRNTSERDSSAHASQIPDQQEGSGSQETRTTSATQIPREKDPHNGTESEIAESDVITTITRMEDYQNDDSAKASVDKFQRKSVTIPRIDEAFDEVTTEANLVMSTLENDELRRLTRLSTWMSVDPVTSPPKPLKSESSTTFNDLTPSVNPQPSLRIVVTEPTSAGLATSQDRNYGITLTVIPSNATERTPVTPSITPPSLEIRDNATSIIDSQLPVASIPMHPYTYTITNLTRLLRNYTGPGPKSATPMTLEAESWKEGEKKERDDEAGLLPLSGVVSIEEARASASVSGDPTAVVTTTPVKEQRDRKIIHTKNSTRNDTVDLAIDAKSDSKTESTIEITTELKTKSRSGFEAEVNTKPIQVTIEPTTETPISKTDSKTKVLTNPSIEIKTAATTEKIPPSTTNKIDAHAASTVRWNYTGRVDNEREIGDRRFMRKSASAVLNQRTTEDRELKRRRGESGGRRIKASKSELPRAVDNKTASDHEVILHNKTENIDAMEQVDDQTTLLSILDVPPKLPSDPMISRTEESVSEHESVTISNAVRNTTSNGLESVLRSLTPGNTTVESTTMESVSTVKPSLFPVTPIILNGSNKVSKDEPDIAESIEAAEKKDPERPFGIAKELDPSEIQKMYRAQTTLKPEPTITILPDEARDDNLTTPGPKIQTQHPGSERSPEVRGRNLSDKSKDKDGVLPIMELYNNSNILNGTDLSPIPKVTPEEGGANLWTTEAVMTNESKSHKQDGVAKDGRIGNSTRSNKNRQEVNREVESPFRWSNTTSGNKTRARPIFYDAGPPEYSGYHPELNASYFESGIIAETPRDPFNVSEVITKRHDGDTLATQETVAIVSYILATLVVFPIAVGVGLILRRLIIRNRKVLEESDTSSEISCRKDALNLENGDFKTSIEKAITKLPRIQHLVSQNEIKKNGNSMFGAEIAKSCHEAEKPPPPSSQESRWEFPRDKLRLQTVLGQGNFGQVWKAEADDLTGHQGTTRLVAVKTVKEGASAREKEDLVRELEIMQQLGNHPNVVTLLGCCTEEEPHYLILEYVMYGKLLAYLRDHRTRQDFYNFSEDSAALTSRDLTVFGYCVARGMEYLASKKIIHRDLAARNVLVDHNKLCKIADFGMSRFANEDGECIETRHGRNALPIRWMAPESLIYSLFTTKTDVWSFGILMWEIVTLGSTPYPDMAAREVMRNVQSGYRLERPSHCRSELFRVIARCWHADPDRRPEFQILRRDLAQLLEDNMNGHYVDLESFASECTD